MNKQKLTVKESFCNSIGMSESDILKADCKIELCTVGKYSITDEFVLKSIAVQGFNHKLVNLETARTLNGQPVQGTIKVLMSDNGQAKRYFTAYVVKTSNKLPDLKPETVSVAPTNASNNRRKSLTEMVSNTPAETLKPESNEIVELKNQVKELTSKFDILVSVMLEQKTQETVSFNPFKRSK